MAEKYGERSPKFTKKWWEYFWMYYKVHTFFVAFLILAIVLTIYGKVTEEKFDITLTYAGNIVFTEDMETEIENTFSRFCNDLDRNGEKSLRFKQLNFRNAQNDPEYTVALSSKLNLMLAEEDTYIFILDKYIADMYSGNTEEDCVFAPLEDWLEVNVSTSSIYSVHGKNYGIDISTLQCFKDVGADFSNHYLFIRYYPREDQIKRQLEGYKGAIELANMIVAE